MPKACVKCGGQFSSFGDTCPPCRKGAAHDEWGHCEKCSAHFKGHGLCFDCKAGVDPFAPKKPVKIVDTPAGNCFACGKAIGYGESISAKGKEYHPECFTCSKCGKKIVGQHKVGSDNVTRTCEDCLDRDLCCGCQQPIGVGKTTIMQGKKYHPDCLVCDACGKLLTNKFCPWEDYLLCTKCGDNPQKALAEGRKTKGTVPEKADDAGKKDYCEVCHKECKDAFLRAQGKAYHQDCFRCSGCRKPLEGTFFPVDGKIWCSHACSQKVGSKASGGVQAVASSPRGGYPAGKADAVSGRTTLQPGAQDETGIRRISPRGAAPSPRGGGAARPVDVAASDCEACGKHIDGQVTKAGGKTYHKECFCCCKCKSMLGERYFPSGKGYLCTMCGEEVANKDSPICSQCKQTIVGQFKKTSDGKAICTRCSPPDSCAACGKTLSGEYLDFDGLKYHNACFKCEGCDKSLAGGSIFTGSKQERFCQSCAEEDREKVDAETIGMCGKCGKVLSGRYVIAEDMKFHKECFSCDKCGKRIEGSFSVEEPSRRYSLRVNNVARKKFICEHCD